MPRPIPGTPEPAPAVDDGILLVDKPEGPTSHDVVARARRALRIRAIGHTGTLDPMATGLLPLVVGRATRLAQFLSHDKGYEACIRLGTTTDTWDRTGAVIAGPIDAARCPSQAEIEACLASFVGNHLQRPPSYSAKMIDGVRAHTLARRGATVDVPPVSVTLFSAELREIAPPLVRVVVRCSAGYYVRTLAHELGERLGCGACLDTLRRTLVGPFSVENAVTLAIVEADPVRAGAALITMVDALSHLARVDLNESDVTRVRHGNEIAVPNDVLVPGGNEPVRLVGPDGRLLAIARPGQRPGFLHPAVVLG